MSFHTIIPLTLDSLEDFWIGLSQSFIPGYEIEKKESFLKRVKEDLTNNPTTYYQLVDDSNHFLGGFRRGRTGITYFFIDLTYPHIDEIMDEVILFFESINSTIRVYTKERYAHLFIKRNFTVEYKRYPMKLDLKTIDKFKLIDKIHVNNMVDFSIAQIEEVISVLYNTYKGTRDMEILGYDNIENIRYALMNLLTGVEDDFVFLPENSYIAVKENHVIGVILIILNLNKPLIFDIAVEKTEQGKGIGRILLLKAIKSLSREYSELNLMVTEDNENAEKLYNSIGFKMISDTLYSVIKQV